MDKSEVLIDNEFFKCEKSVDKEGRTEWGMDCKTSVEKTIKHLVELYNKAKSYTETNKA